MPNFQEYLNSTEKFVTQQITSLQLPIVTTCNRFKKISSESYDKLTILCLALINRISTFICKFIWPFSSNTKHIPTLSEMVQKGGDGYQGRSEEKALVVRQILDTPACLEDKVTLIPENYKQQFKIVQRIGQFIGTFATCQSSNLSPGEAFIWLKVIQYTSNRITDPLGIVLPREIAIKQWEHENNCQRIAEVATASVFLTFSNNSQAVKVASCVQFVFLGAASFPEIQDYLPEAPLLKSIIKSLDENISSIHSKAKETFIRPLIKEYVMPKLVERMVSFASNKGPSSMINALDLMLEEYTVACEKQLREATNNINELKIHHSNNPSSVSESNTNILYNWYSNKNRLANDLIWYNDRRQQLKSADQIIAGSIGAIDRSESILASITAVIIEQHFSEPTEKLIGKAFQKTEDIFTDIAMSLVTSKIKNIAWSYLNPSYDQPLVATGLSSVLGISMPLFNGIVIVANGGSEQSIGQLAARIFGAAVAIQTGSFFLGTVVVYGCFLGKYGIKLRKRHLERNGMEDPLLQLMDSVVEGAKKSFSDIGLFVQTEMKKTEIREQISAIKKQQELVQLEEKKKEATSYQTPLPKDQGKGSYSLEEVLVPTFGLGGKMSYRPSFKLKAKPRFVMRRPKRESMTEVASSASNRSGE